MKKFIDKQKNCFITLIGLVIMCEILLKIDSKITQVVGVALTPVIAILVYLVIRNDQKEMNK